MDEMIYKAITDYYHALSKLGYFNYKDVYKFLVLCFYRDFLFENYRDKITKEDYHAIERALNCLYGSNCLMPYPNYTKMGNLHLGDMTELSHRVRVLEDTQVLKVITNLQTVSNADAESDIKIIADE